MGLSSSSAGNLASPSEGDGQPSALLHPVLVIAAQMLHSQQDMTCPKHVLQSLVSFLITEDGLVHC